MLALKRYAIMKPYIEVLGWCPRDVGTNMLNCVIAVSRFELQSHDYVHFWINIIGKVITNTLFPTDIG